MNWVREEEVTVLIGEACAGEKVAEGEELSAWRKFITAFLLKFAECGIVNGFGVGEIIDLTSGKLPNCGSNGDSLLAD